MICRLEGEWNVWEAIADMFVGDASHILFGRKIKIVDFT